MAKGLTGAAFHVTTSSSSGANSNIFYAGLHYANVSALRICSKVTSPV